MVRITEFIDVNCYISLIMSRRFAVLIALIAFATSPAIVLAQDAVTPGASRTPAGATGTTNASTLPAARKPVLQTPSSPATNPAGEPQSTASEPPQIIVNPPAPVVQPWTWREQVAWGADIVLAVLGYAGIMLFLRFLKRIERNTESGATTAQAALDTAQAALEQTRALIQLERPWIVIRVEPSLTKENSFRVMATNRGRAPGKIVGLLDRVQLAVDETNLPATPEYEGAKSPARPEPIILLPSESVAIKTFSRDDVRSVCKTPEEFEKVELWEKNIFVYGRVTYRDMVSPTEEPAHTSDWCYWYIHGDKKSALTIAGTPEYNKHT